MKIVIVNSLYTPHIIGGAEISTQILAETLSSAADVHVFTTGGQKGSAGISSERINGVTVHRLPYNNLYWIGDGEGRGTLHKVARRLVDMYNPMQIGTVSRLLTQIRPDLVHTQNLSGFGAGIWSAFHKAGVPIVHTLRDYSLISPVSSPIESPLLARLYKLPSLAFSKRVSAVVGISSHILNRHTESGLFPNAEHLVIPNAVEGEIAAGEKDFARKPLRVGYFGRIEQEKGVNEIVDAVRSLPKEKVERLYVCGEGKLKEELSAACGDDGRIVFTGKVKPAEARELMAKVDVTVVPSIWEEPFGRVIIESYQVGTPVYASAVGGIPDVVMNRGFLFAPGSSGAIQDKLMDYYRYSAEEKQTIQNQCLEHSRKFTKQSLFEQHKELYQSVMLGQSGHAQSEKTFSGKNMKAGAGR
ncbi:glycosyltransferase family 4 protein [Paenibacillus arenilitoris]|uniref:Glycosyltransferase family 4 protein n=1 Tax=Paenibacillus arenilitoris TaxID=2772299 RepID=A0A927CRG0_9BACL|nr:glycosyltransferase family 4 protein [Paenibacillus arenilitoris]MBD2872145.1 glycosyltransferase family 4 protein [Paenibacillus arenilitoris]